jgi:hypothetical protein
MNKQALWVCVTIAAMGIGTAAAAANGVKNEQKAATETTPVKRNRSTMPVKHSARHVKHSAAQTVGSTARPHGTDTRHLRPTTKKIAKPQFNSLKLSRIEQRRA